MRSASASPFSATPFVPTKMRVVAGRADHAARVSDASPSVAVELDLVERAVARLGRDPGREGAAGAVDRRAARPCRRSPCSAIDSVFVVVAPPQSCGAGVESVIAPSTTLRVAAPPAGTCATSFFVTRVVRARARGRGRRRVPPPPPPIGFSTAIGSGSTPDVVVRGVGARAAADARSASPSAASRTSSPSLPIRSSRPVPPVSWSSPPPPAIRSSPGPAVDDVVAVQALDVVVPGAAEDVVVLGRAAEADVVALAAVDHDRAEEVQAGSGRCRARRRSRSRRARRPRG